MNTQKYIINCTTYYFPVSWSWIAAWNWLQDRSIWGQLYGICDNYSVLGEF